MARQHQTRSRRQHRHAVLLPLAPPNHDLPPVEVNVLDAKLQALQQPETLTCRSTASHDRNVDTSTDPMSSGWRFRWKRMNLRVQPAYASSVLRLKCRTRHACRTRSVAVQILRSVWRLAAQELQLGPDRVITVG